MEKLINKDKLKDILDSILDIFEKYNLNRGEIEFVSSELTKLVASYEKHMPVIGGVKA